MNRPNLFDYATSELSQDAFICWLLKWASPEYKIIDGKLNTCALNFIYAIFKKHTKTPPLHIEKIKIFRQDKKIDVLCIINDIYAILIEDKIGTINHSNQLSRYFESVKVRDFKEENILPIYFKTEDQGDYTDVLGNGYKLFLRSDSLDILNTYSRSNTIIIDYRSHLQSISDQVESYKSVKIENWERYQWIGFYLRIQEELDDSNWDYIPNPQGGFLGFYWHFQGDNNCKQYLQLEQNKLCFKIFVNNPKERSVLRNKWFNIIYNKADERRIKLKKPSRFGNGRYMTVCIYDEYRECNNYNQIDVDKTIKKLKIFESILEVVKDKA